MNSKDFPKGYKPILVYVPAEAGTYTAKITIGEDYEKIDWVESDHLLKEKEDEIRELREEIKVITTLYENQKAEIETVSSLLKEKDDEITQLKSALSKAQSKITELLIERDERK